MNAGRTINILLSIVIVEMRKYTCKLYGKNVLVYACLDAPPMIKDALVNGSIGMAAC